MVGNASESLAGVDTGDPRVEQVSKYLGLIKKNGDRLEGKWTESVHRKEKIWICPVGLQIPQRGERVGSLKVVGYMAGDETGNFQIYDGGEEEEYLPTSMLSGFPGRECLRVSEADAKA